MLTIVRKENDLADKKGSVLEIIGKSTDEKPIENINNGSRFIEIDTGKIYHYDKETEQWLEF